MKKYTQEKFITKVKEVHGDKYDYSKVIYEGVGKKITLICKKHGEFVINAGNIINQNQGCKKCGVESRTSKQRLTKEDFIKRSNQIHSNQYDYSKVKLLKNNHAKVEIICKHHGIFLQTPKIHLRGFGCSSCSGNKKKDTAMFIQEAKKIHGDKYNYSKSEYTGAIKKLTIICPIHGDFFQQARKHTERKYGCPECKTPKGEREISKFLKENNISYKPQFVFEDCKNINPLPFDFYLPNHNVCIEYNGRQHYIPIAFFGGEEGLKKTKERDKIKKEYCKKNNITLFYIRYNENFEDKINKILYFLKNHSL